MRLFIAINFDSTVKARIRNAADQLREHAVLGRFVRDEHMHLTLEFLGEVEPNHIPEVCDAMDALDVKPFVMRTGDMDCFKRRDGDLWFLKIAASRFLCGTPEAERPVDTLHHTPQPRRFAKDEPLYQLQNALHCNLKKQGFRLENRPYKPHITLARNVILRSEDNAQAPRCFDNFATESSQQSDVTALTSPPSIEIDVHSIELMQSAFEGGRLIYTPLHSKPLI